MPDIVEADLPTRPIAASKESSRSPHLTYRGHIPSGFQPLLDTMSTICQRSQADQYVKPLTLPDVSEDPTLALQNFMEQLYTAYANASQATTTVPL
jgi:hypothetical protein